MAVLLHLACAKADQTALSSSVEIATSEGPVNLTWGAIMKTIQEDPHEFFAMGGWTFLTGDSDVSVQYRVSASKTENLRLFPYLGRR